MSTKNKNSKNKSFEKFEIQVDGVRIFSKRMLILLIVVPIIIAGIVSVRNVSYKADISELQAKLVKQENDINKLNSDVICLKDDLLKKQIDLAKLEQQVENYIVINSDLSLEKQRIQSSILKDISVMQNSIYAMNNQIKLIKKRLQPKNQAKKK